MKNIWTKISDDRLDGKFGKKKKNIRKNILQNQQNLGKQALLHNALRVELVRSTIIWKTLETYTKKNHSHVHLNKIFDQKKKNIL